MRPDAAVDIIQELRRHGHQAYLVGGCVRDMVMGIEPSDYDIATSATPPEVIAMFPRTEAVGAQFGVVLVIQEGHPYEVATFRSDEAYVDGRRPTGVVFTNARQDVLRRDFTINGLLYDPIEDQLIDYVSGRDDIKARIVRCIGDPHRRFEEDKLRILRAVRFGARLGYTIESATWDAVREMAPQIRQVSMERIREELVRILTEGQAARGFRMLEESGLRAAILPELQWTDHLERSAGMLQTGAAGDFATGVLLHELDRTAVRSIVERLKFSRAEAHHITALAENRQAFATIRQMTISRLKRFFRLPRFEDHLDLERIHALAGGADLDAYAFAWRKHQEWTREDIEPELHISGADLIQLGFTPGPLFKEILARVEDEQLEGRVRSRSEAIEFVMRHYPKETQ